MATGPEHYRLSEEALRNAEDAHFEDPLLPYHLATAQIHATLALAAVTADAGWRSGFSPSCRDAWAEAGALA